MKTVIFTLILDVNTAYLLILFECELWKENEKYPRVIDTSCECYNFKIDQTSSPSTDTMYDKSKNFCINRRKILIF